MYNGMIISDLVAVVERAERSAAIASALKNFRVIEMPASPVFNFAYPKELGVA